MKITPEAVREKLEPHVKRWLALTVTIESIRAEVVPAYNDMLKQYTTQDGETANYDNSYRMNDDDATAYYKQMDQWIECSRFYVERAGYCPLLVAEHDKVKCSWDILSAMDAVCGQEKVFSETYGETRDKAIGLAVQLVTSRPGFMSPTADELREAMSPYLKKEVAV